MPPKKDGILEAEQVSSPAKQPAGGAPAVSTAVPAATPTPRLAAAPSSTKN